MEERLRNATIKLNASSVPVELCNACFDCEIKHTHVLCPHKRVPVLILRLREECVQLAQLQCTVSRLNVIVHVETAVEGERGEISSQDIGKVVVKRRGRT